VTVGVPVYNGQRYLARALDSLPAQTFDDFEIVLCDNASEDRTGTTVARQPRLLLLPSSTTRRTPDGCSCGHGG
jgi:glycosyltransferase involved in cell wall biosynthesis